MAIRKICGIETEYGIVLRGAGESEPDRGVVDADQRLRARARARPARRPAPKVGWDFEDESPGNDARGLRADGRHGRPRSRPTSSTPCSPTAPATTSTTPTPSCPRPSAPTPASIVRVRPGRRADPAAVDGRPPAGCCPTGQEIVVYKNNSDGKGNSYGCHENYLMDRAGAVRPHRHPRHAALRHPPDLHRRRQGRHARPPGSAIDEVPFQLTQRADFFEEEVGLETTLKRPIVNTRDEPHADAAEVPPPPRDRRRRQPVRGRHLPQGRHHRPRAGHDRGRRPARATSCFAAPGAGACARSSYDLTPAAGRSSWPTAPRVTALEVQWELLRPGPQVRRGARARRASARRSAPRSCGAGSRCSPASRPTRCRLADQLDWVAKYRLIDGYRERHDLDVGRRPPAPPWTCSTTTCARTKSLFARVGLERLTDDDEVERGHAPSRPTDTRAYFRGKCLQRWADDIVAANWDSLVFDIGGDPLRRVPMMEPTARNRGPRG